MMECEVEHTPSNNGDNIAVAFITITDSISMSNGVALCGPCCVGWMRDWVKDPGRETYEIMPIRERASAS